MQPSVEAMSVKEWPLPTTLTRSPRSAEVLTIATISSSVLGDSIRAGEQAAVPAQFVQCVLTDITIPPGPPPTNREPLAQSPVAAARVGLRWDPQLPPLIRLDPPPPPAPLSPR